MSLKTAGAKMRQASQSMQVESTKKSPGTLSGSLRAGPAPRLSITRNERVPLPAFSIPHMFDNLQDKMDRVFKTLRGEAALNEWHIDNALKEIRVALLEADVHFKVVKEFTNRVREKAVGQEVLTAFSPAQQVTKIVRDELQNAPRRQRSRPRARRLPGRGHDGRPAGLR